MPTPQANGALRISFAREVGAKLLPSVGELFVLTVRQAALRKPFLESMILLAVAEWLGPDLPAFRTDEETDKQQCRVGVASVRQWVQVDSCAVG